MREHEFERLYRESYPIVYNYVNYRMTDPTAVEDVVANAYLNAARAFDRFDPTRSKFSTWVISIAMNCMRSYYRKERPSVSLEDVAESNFATSGGQDDVNDRELVRQLLTHLDDFERNLIALKYALGYRNVDIARELGMNASTVSTKLANAIAKMRAQLPS